MKVYHQFTLRERHRLYAYLSMDKKIDEIALRLNKNRSSIYREIKRNNYRNNYLPDTAHKKYVKRRSRKGLSKIKELYCFIFLCTKKGYKQSVVPSKLVAE